MTQNDPTDHALAAIASILDHKEMSEGKDRQPETQHAAEAEIMSVTAAPEAVIVEHDSPETVPEPVDVDGYSRVGPGPLDAIRFRWTARRDDDGNYFVDETIGTSSRPISSGPMPRDEVIDFIDARERAARDRFDALKSQMTLHHPIPGRENFGEF